MPELVENYCCPSCSGKLKLSHCDSIGTKFFKCEKCGQLTSNPKVPTPKTEDSRFCEFCSKFHTEQCKFKDDPAAPNKDSKACTEYKKAKPKIIRNRCGTCAAFHTPFCTWEYTNFEDRETRSALHVEADAYTCSLYFPRPRVETESEKKFLKKVERLE